MAELIFQGRKQCRKDLWVGHLTLDVLPWSFRATPLCWPPWPAPIKKTMALMFLRHQGSGWECCCICFCEQPKKRTQMEVESGG